MMLIEQRVYRLLNNDESLRELLDQLRGRPFDDSGEIETGIFIDDIPEAYRKEETAPFIRINPLDEFGSLFADDEAQAELQTVQVDWWCKNANHSLQIKKRIDKILLGSGMSQYYSNRYRDPEIKLKMNVRKYRYVDFKL